jgi:hypothetical protein
MKSRRFSTTLIIALLLAFVLPLAAQSDAVFLGAFSETFTTFVVAGDLAHPGELDWYTFDVVGDNATLFILAEGTGNESEIRALLFDEEDTYIATSDNGYLEATLAPGTYRIRVDSIRSDVQSYSLTVFNGVEIESNDGLLESDDLGNISGRIRVSASLLPEGDADFFRFQVSENGLPGNNNAILIRTSGPTAGDTVLILYQYNDTEERYLPIAFDDDSGDGYWSRLLLRPQPGGLYALRAEETAYPLEGIDNYILLLVPIILLADEEPNNTSARATELAPISAGAPTWRADGLLDADDTIDFYKLAIETSALIQINTESQSDAGDYDTVLVLYTPGGDLLAENDDGGDVSWSRIVMSLEAGEYFVTVEADDYESALIPYHLRVTAKPVKTMAEVEPNDTEETAEFIEWAAGEVLLIEAVIGLEGDIDSFRFVLSEETALVFETGPRAGSSESNDTTLAIYDEDLWEIAYNDDSNGSWSRIEQTLAAGTYYIVVEGYYSDETFEYTLLISEP